MLIFQKNKISRKNRRNNLNFPFRAKLTIFLNFSVKFLYFSSIRIFALKWMILRTLEFIRRNIEFFIFLNYSVKISWFSYIWIFAPKISRICSYIGSEMWWDIHDFHWRDPIVQKVRRSRISDWPGFHICWNSPKTTGFLRDKVTKMPN